MARVVVEVMPKPEILDPQGKAITGSLRRLGFEGFSVRQGKRFEIEMAEAVTADRLREINQFAETLLANTVIETFKVSVEDPAAIVETDPIDEIYEETVQLREKKAAEAAAVAEESIALIEAIDSGELMKKAASMAKAATGEQPAVTDDEGDQESPSESDAPESNEEVDNEETVDAEDSEAQQESDDSEERKEVQ
jgi:phosphoribosylformylglycinamidine synthase PurS subunit